MARGNKVDWYLVFTVLSLLIFGVLMVYNASSANALRDFGDKYYFLKEQVKWALIGTFAMIFFAFFDYRQLYKFSPFILVVALIALISVFIPGLGVKAYGAHRVIDLRFTVLQPSEFSKLVLIIYLSAWFSAKEKGRLLAFGLLLFIFVGLILLEPDMGTAIVLGAVGVILYFLSEAPFYHFLALLPAAALGAIFLAINSSYRQ